jgi:hypothetical protein
LYGPINILRSKATIVVVCFVEVIRDQQWIMNRHQMVDPLASEVSIQGVSFEAWADRLNQEAEDYAKNALNITISIPRQRATARHAHTAQTNKTEPLVDNIVAGLSAAAGTNLHRTVRSKAHPHRTIRRRKGGSVSAKSFYPRDWRTNPRRPKVTSAATLQEPIFDSSWDYPSLESSDDGLQTEGDNKNTANAILPDEFLNVASSLLRDSLKWSTVRHEDESAHPRATNTAHGASSASPHVLPPPRDGSSELSRLGGGQLESHTSRMVAEEQSNEKESTLEAGTSRAHVDRGSRLFDRIRHQRAPRLVPLREDEEAEPPLSRLVTKTAVFEDDGKGHTEPSQIQGRIEKRAPVAVPTRIVSEMKKEDNIVTWTPFDTGKNLTYEHKKRIVYTWADKRRVAHHIYINEEHKLMITTIPKVACTEFMKLMIRMSGARNWRMDPHFRPKNPVLSRLEPSEASRVLNDRLWTKAVFFRDPVERLLSAYLDKVRGCSCSMHSSKV